MRNLWQLLRRSPETLPLAGLPGPRTSIPLVDDLDDATLESLNTMLDWNAFVLDRHGRRFGNRAWAGKRDVAQPVPDPRIVRLNEVVDLTDKDVVEIGCFEGIHTVGLLRFARGVTAVDARLENVVKTLVRVGMFDQRCRVLRIDVERLPNDLTPLIADVVHHVGVLYHLEDPVRHLTRIADCAGAALMLDTHYALPDEVGSTYEVDGRTFHFKVHDEGPTLGVFSGMRRFSKWLLLDELTALVASLGFTELPVMETRNERNGPRVLLVARR